MFGRVRPNMSPRRLFLPFDSFTKTSQTACRAVRTLHPTKNYHIRLVIDTHRTLGRPTTLGGGRDAWRFRIFSVPRPWSFSSPASPVQHSRSHKPYDCSLTPVRPPPHPHMSVLERYTPTWPFYTPWRTTNHLSAWPWKNVHFGLWTVSPGYLSVISCRNPFFFSNLWNKVQKIRVCVFLKFVFTSVCNASVSQPLDAVEFDLNTKCHEFVFSSASNQPRIFGISKTAGLPKKQKISDAIKSTGGTRKDRFVTFPPNFIQNW